MIICANGFLDDKHTYTILLNNRDTQTMACAVVAMRRGNGDVLIVLAHRSFVDPVCVPATGSYLFIGYKSGRGHILLTAG
jgi:hypothetical protein